MPLFGMAVATASTVVVHVQDACWQSTGEVGQVEGLGVGGKHQDSCTPGMFLYALLEWPAIVPRGLLQGAKASRSWWAALANFVGSGLPLCRSPVLLWYLHVKPGILVSAMHLCGLLHEVGAS